MTKDFGAKRVTHAASHIVSTTPANFRTDFFITDEGFVVVIEELDKQANPHVRVISQSTWETINRTIADDVSRLPAASISAPTMNWKVSPVNAAKPGQSVNKVAQEITDNLRETIERQRAEREKAEAKARVDADRDRHTIKWTCDHCRHDNGTYDPNEVRGRIMLRCEACGRFSEKEAHYPHNGEDASVADDHIFCYGCGERVALPRWMVEGETQSCPRCRRLLTRPPKSVAFDEIKPTGGRFYHHCPACRTWFPFTSGHQSTYRCPNCGNRN